MFLMATFRESCTGLELNGIWTHDLSKLMAMSIK